jgi:hypothetical protein
MDPIVMAAGTAVVSAMATGAWEQARDAMVAWWREVHPRHAEDVGAELEATRSQALAARDRGDEETEQALAGSWRLRLQRLLETDPTLDSELRRLVEEHLTPALPDTERTTVQQIIINAEAHGHARQYVAGRDQHITGT